MKKRLILLLAAGGLLSTGALLADDSMEPLNIELPKPLFAGTPKPVSGIPNLETPRTEPRAAIMVPKGTKNLAAGKEVTSSDDWPIIGELEFVTDGDKEGEEGYYVELGPDTQWVQIDLGEVCHIHAVVVWHYHAEARVYHDVIAQVSNDPTFKDGVKTIYNNDHDNSAEQGVGKDMAYIETNEGRLMAASATGQYVRLYSGGNTSNKMNHYIEVEVFGQPR